MFSTHQTIRCIRSLLGLAHDKTGTMTDLPKSGERQEGVTVPGWSGFTVCVWQNSITIHIHALWSELHYQSSSSSNALDRTVYYNCTMWGGEKKPTAKCSLFGACSEWMVPITMNSHLGCCEGRGLGDGKRSTEWTNEIGSVQVVVREEAQGWWELGKRLHPSPPWFDWRRPRYKRKSKKTCLLCIM